MPEHMQSADQDTSVNRDGARTQSC